jgi:CheY-like chemotaxis protein
VNKEGSIIIIEDDPDDIDIYRSIFKDLGTLNEVCYFNDSEYVIVYLREIKTKPFLLLSDVNMSPLNGFELRKIIHNDPILNNKCVPYIFFTTDASPKTVEQAYMLSVQGIFEKPNDYNQWKIHIESILNYWTYCMSPLGKP